MAKSITLNLCHLYPDLMDTYGDSGNIIAISKRSAWRGFKVMLKTISVGQKLDANLFDFYFFGGGQDNAQTIVALDLQKKAKQLKNAIENQAVLLSICGGYQLLQNYFKTKEGNVINGIGIFDAYTIGSSERMIQNLLVEIEPKLNFRIKQVYATSQFSNHTSTKLIGFENHSGKTYLAENTKPLGTVIAGSGNNGQDKTEGAVYKNAYGCYLHGSLLPKNPHFADFLIKKALERKYGNIKLKPLDDSLEWQAHLDTTKTVRSPL